MDWIGVEASERDLNAGIREQVVLTLPGISGT